MMTMPGFNVKLVEKKWVRSAQVQIMFRVLLNWRSSPFILVRMSSICGSGISSAVTMHGPSGALLSNAFPRPSSEGIFRISEHICNLNRFALQQNSAAYTAASWCIYQGLDVFIELGRVTVACCGVSIARLSRSVGGFEPCRPRIAERQTRPGY